MQLNEQLTGKATYQLTEEPGVLTEWFESPFPILPDRLVRSNKWLKKEYLSLPSHGLGIIKIRPRSGRFSVRIMWVSEISGHGTGNLISQWRSNIKSQWVHTMTCRCPSWYEALKTIVVHPLCGTVLGLSQCVPQWARCLNLMWGNNWLIWRKKRSEKRT